MSNPHQFDYLLPEPDMTPGQRVYSGFVTTWGMKTLIALAAVFPLVANAATFECTVKDVKVTSAHGMLYDGDSQHKKKIGKTFYVDRKTGLMQGALSNNLFTFSQQLVDDKVASHQHYFVLSHENNTAAFTGDPLAQTSGAAVLHIWVSENPEYKPDGYPFAYVDNYGREFYSGTCK